MLGNLTGRLYARLEYNPFLQGERRQVLLVNIFNEAGLAADCGVSRSPQQGREMAHE
jgi:hypothetical protein